MNKYIILFLSSLFIPINSYAFKIEPMSASIIPTKLNATYPFYISNNSDKPAAIQISPLKANLNVDGVETREPADELFLIQPSQSILMPKKSKIVKVSWLGGDVESEKVFRLYAEQLPIKIDEEEGTKVNILVNYMPLLFITPENAKYNLKKPEMVIKSKGDKKTLEIMFENTGNKNIVILNIKPNIKDSKGNTVKMIDEEYKSLRVWAGQKRRIKLQVSDKSSIGPATGEVSYTVYN